MAADDYLNSPQGFPADLDGASTSGNRPASGARRATPGEVLSQGFQGAQNAGDFLGLDTEFTAASQDPNQAYGMGTPLDLVPPPSTHAPDDAGYAPAEPAPLPQTDPVQEFAQAPSAFEFGEDLGSEEGDGKATSDTGGGKGRFLVGALALIALAAAGVYYGPELLQRFSGEAEQVAKTPAPTPSPKGPGTKKEPAPTPSDVTPVVASQPETAPLAADPEPAPPTKTAAAPSRPSRNVQPDHTSEPVITKVPTPTPLAQEAPATPTPLSSVPRPAPGQSSFPNLADYEWASEDQLELIWRGNEIPMEAIQAQAKTLMPRVGNVRVFTISGDVFEGRLYAVGEGLVWLDGKPGRIGLDGSRVERIDILPPQAENVAVNEKDAVGGRRVRVRVPGGMLYGSVLKSEGEDVTLALEDGGRVRVKAADLQDLGSGRAIVVSR
jgi:hypothetical protein